MAAKARATLGADTHPGLPGKIGPLDKVEMYGWEMVDRPGKYMRLSKHVLNVDHDYQRDHIKRARVNRIASQWSWVRFGSLSVAERPDGTYWVFDGQHRKLAADKRSDITEVPCMVYKSVGPADESRYFLGINEDRGRVDMIDRFKAMMAQNDPLTLNVHRLVTESGYRVERGGADYTVMCVGALVSAVDKDPEAAAVAWRICVQMFDGSAILDRVFRGMFVAERHIRRHGLGTLLDARFKTAVDRLDPKTITKSIFQAAEYWGKSGPNVEGEAVVRLLNKGRGRNPIPSLFAERPDDAN